MMKTELEITENLCYGYDEEAQKPYLDVRGERFWVPHEMLDPLVRAMAEHRNEWAESGYSGVVNQARDLLWEVAEHLQPLFCVVQSQRRLEDGVACPAITLFVTKPLQHNDERWLLPLRVEERLSEGSYPGHLKGAPHLDVFLKEMETHHCILEGVYYNQKGQVLSEYEVQRLQQEVLDGV
jgi:hypothetical protein